MADNNDNPVNKSNKSVNGRSKVERIQSRREDALGEYTDRQQELEAAIASEESKYKDLEAKYNQASDKNLRAAINAKLGVQAEKYTQAEERFAQYEAQHAQKVNAHAAQEIATYTKYENINKRTTTMAGSQRYFSQIQQDARAGGELLQTPTEVIEQRIRSNQVQAARLGRELAGQTRGLGYDDWSDDMKDKNRRLQQLQEDTALDKRLMKVQIKESMTTEKRQYAAKDVLGRAGSILGDKQLEQDVREGKYGSIEKETEKLSRLFEKLSDATQKFEEASQNATDAQGNLTKEYKDASKALDDLQKTTDKQRRIVGEVGRQGGGAFGERFASGLVGFNKAAATGYAIDIEDEMSEMRLKSAMGKRALAQYERRNAAIGGDMSALLREAAGQQFTTDFSDKLRAREMRRAGLTITGGAEKEIGTIIDNVVGGFKGGKGKKGGAIKGIVKGLGKGVKSLGGGAAVMAADITRRGTQIGRGIPQTQTALEAGMAADDFAETMLAVPADNLQAFYNNYMAQSGATMGLGISGGELLRRKNTDTSQINRYAQFGLGSAEVAGLTAQAISAVGGAEDHVRLVERAGRMQQSRIVSGQQYMNMTGQLSNLGGSSDNLETIMRNAVAAGMDNSKNIQQMVSATAAMSNDLVNSGISGVESAGNILSVGVQNLRKIGVNKNIATQAAQYANESVKSWSKDTSLNIGTMHEMQRIREIAPGIDSAYQMRIASLTQTQMQSILDDPSNAGKFGLSDVYNQVGKDKFKEFAKADMSANLMYRSGAYALLSDEQRKNINSAVESGDLSKISGPAKALLNMVTGGANIAGISIAGQAAKESMLSTGVAGKSEEQKIIESNAAAQKIIAAQGKVGTEERMDMLITTMQTMLERLDPATAQAGVERGAKDMDETPPIVQAGDKFNKGTDKFAKAVNDFDKILKRVDLNKQKTGGIILEKQSDSNRSKGR